MVEKRMWSDYSDRVLVGLLMQRLYLLYDNGGHSGRSVRSRLLESSLGLLVLPEINGDELMLCARAIQHEASIRSQERIQDCQLVLFPELEHLFYEEYSVLTIGTLLQLNEGLETVSTTEAALLECIASLLQIHSRFRYLNQGMYSPEDLVREGMRRYFPTSIL